MDKHCEHIQNCKACNKSICNYCVEICSGCPLEGCEQCFTKHLVKCKECSKLLCPEEIIGDICPACKMQKEISA